MSFNIKEATKLLLEKIKETMKLSLIRFACYLDNIFGDQPCPSNDEDVIKDWNIERKIDWFRLNGRIN